jgi:hypothetical protein
MSKVKVILLNNGDFKGLDEVKFPVEVEATLKGRLAEVTGSELHAVGAEHVAFDRDVPYSWFIGTACELVEELI